MAYIHPEEIAEFMEQVREHLEMEVMLGFRGRKKMIEAVMGAVGLEEYAEDLREQLGELRKQVVATVDELLEKSREEEGQWPEVTDCDRLDKAFADLEEDRILAAQRLGETAEMGREQVLGLIESLQEDERPAGYVFVDEGSIWECFEDGVLELWFGSVADDPERTKAVGLSVVARLTEAGFQAQWDGRPEHPVQLVDFLWQKRRPEEGR